MLLQQAITDFRTQFRGTVIEPEEPAYDEARKVYNGMINRKPRLIAMCTDKADVIAAVCMARKNALRVSIRGGGHNAAGLGVCDEGMVIDVSRINYVRVDPVPLVPYLSARVVSGATSIMRHMRLVSLFRRASSPATGVAGLTLGGGLGTSYPEIWPDHRQPAFRGHRAC